MVPFYQCYVKYKMYLHPWGQLKFGRLRLTICNTLNGPTYWPNWPNFTSKASLVYPSVSGAL